MAAAAVGGRGLVGGRGERGQEMPLQGLRAGELGGLQESYGVGPRGVAVDGAGHGDHQRGDEHPGQVLRTRAAPLPAQPVQDGFPHGAARTAVDTRTAGERQIEGDVVQGQVVQLDDGGLRQRPGLHGLGVLLGPAGEEQRGGGAVELFERCALQAAGDFVEPVHDGQDPAGVDQCAGQIPPVCGGTGEAVVAYQLVAHPVAQGDGGRVP